EIMTDYYGEGLNHTLQRYAYKVSGILNGINAEEYNPSKDTMIPQKYSIKNYEEGKAVNKKSIQEQLGLEVNPGAPLCSMISRLVDQKGLDLLLRVVEEMLYDGMQIVILGTGDAYYERSLADIAARNPGKMCACISFDNGLAHTLYAGSDIFLMPSLFEPCGLSQLIAMTYGTIPIVRETGGLRDTVVPYNEFTGEGNGFSFANINAHEFLFVTKYACDLYRHNKPVWNKLIEEGMKADYSWKKSAEEYAGLYSFITGISIADDEEPEKKPLTEEILDIGKEKKEEAPKKVKKTTAKKPEVKKTTTKAASSEKKSTASKSASKTSKTSSASAKKTTKAASEKSESKASSSKETKKS
ncbi:MAG TPA: hypothetical protein DEO39_03230, partial [Clostridiales bacterium]|nr:hypothetical protein [Clostridiales bacterium]